MYLNNYLLKYCKENDLSSIIKSLANAAVEISSSIRNIKKIGSNISAEKTVNKDGDIQKPLDIIIFASNFKNLTQNFIISYTWQSFRNKNKRKERC